MFCLIILLKILVLFTLCTPVLLTEFQKFAPLYLEGSLVMFVLNWLVAKSLSWCVPDLLPGMSFVLYVVIVEGFQCLIVCFCGLISDNSFFLCLLLVGYLALYKVLMLVCRNLFKKILSMLDLFWRLLKLILCYHICSRIMPNWSFTLFLC